ncbi:MAG: GNAT family N-acetyltransferase [Geminicoccaceae bacterium]|nr:MAG: GNAT family N-acetyltransferase [Geminicoccaceae bacterium]
MSSEFEVRPAGAADRAALARLMAELQEVERALEADRAPGPEMAESHLAFLEAEAAAHDGFVLVAARGPDVLGFVIGWIEHEMGTFIRADERRHGRVTDLCVDPRARGAGVGRALMAAADAHFQKLGVAVVKLVALEVNHAARAFYAAVGYDDHEVILRKRL